MKRILNILKFVSNSRRQNKFGKFNGNHKLVLIKKIMLREAEFVAIAAREGGSKANFEIVLFCEMWKIFLVEFKL